MQCERRVTKYNKKENPLNLKAKRISTDIKEYKNEGTYLRGVLTNSPSEVRYVTLPF